jgi:glycosyltransferase involved in cell wall biosynthesis
MENKPVLVFQAPVGTKSGYGERSRDLVRALIAQDKYDIKIVSTRWGNTAMDALIAGKDDDIVSRFLTHQLQQQPEIFVQVTIPNEFTPMGKYNIGVTAGIETTVASPEFIEGCNRMDLTLVSSNHAKDVLINSVYEKRDQNGSVLGQVRITKPVEILFEGVDIEKYKKLDTIQNQSIKNIMSDVKEDFCYLFVGHWLQGAFGEDRKNVSGLIRCFYEAFKNKQNAPALILKTSGASTSKMDQAELSKKIKEIKKSLPDALRLPNIYIVHGDLTDSEMNDLYNHPKVKAHISFTKGEGFGRPLLEASLTGKPIIVSKYSGHLDFLNPDYCTLLEGKLTQVHPSVVWDKIIVQDSQWFTVDYGYAIGVIKDVEKNYKNYLEKSRKHIKFTKDNFTMEHMTSKLQSIMDSYIPNFPKQVALKLPSLKKLSGETKTEAPKIQLPKLKKID